MKRFVKVVHKHVRASLMYCIIAKTHRSKMFFQIQNDDWQNQNWKQRNCLSSRRQRNLAWRLQVWSFWDEIVQESQSTVSSLAAETELSLNLTEPCTPRSADPVEWWKHNAIRPPNLAAIAMSFLGAPPSSVPSERLFSSAEDLHGDHRCRLLPENAERLVFFFFFFFK